MPDFITGFIFGALLGAAVALLVSLIRWHMGQKHLRETFSALACQALDANTQRLSLQVGNTLDGKKELIDQAVTAVNERLEQVRHYLSTLESQRKQDFGQLAGAVTSLSSTAGALHQMLASSKRRGSWGERMAEDIVRLAGLQEGVNYFKQSGEASESGRPDFTFELTNGLTVNMDVKFPLDSYKRYVDATDEVLRQSCLKDLVTTVRGHVRAVAGRGYVDPKSTVPYVIVFLASEHVYSAVLEACPDLIDEAMGMHVVLASPLTLYAMLAVMRQAAEHANITKTADEVSALMGQFFKQWQKYNEEADRLGQRLDSTVKQFETLRGLRTTQLEKPLERIEQIRSSRGLTVNGNGNGD